MTWLWVSLAFSLSVAGIVGSRFPVGSRWLASQAIFYISLPFLVIAWLILGTYGVFG